MAIGAIDIDDIMNDFLPCFYRWHNRVYKTNIAGDQLYDFHVATMLGIDDATAEDRIEEFTASEEFMAMKPDPKAILGTHSLKFSGHELYVLTSRHDKIRDHTRLWVPLHFVDVFTDVLFSSNAHTIRSSGKQKHEVLADIQADFFVEDNLLYVLPASSVVKYVFLLDRQWNQTSQRLPKNIIRVYDWLEITAKVRSLFPTK